MGPCSTPLHFIFEDRLHNYDVTEQSFDLFEDPVVVGGVVLLHNVGCCPGGYPGPLRLVAERVYSNESYRGVFFDLPTSWSDLDDGSARRMWRRVNASLDRHGYQEKLLSSFELRHGGHLRRDLHQAQVSDRPKRVPTELVPQHARLPTGASVAWRVG